jgi:hypothetical protein
MKLEWVSSDVPPWIQHDNYHDDGDNHWTWSLVCSIHLPPPPWSSKRFYHKNFVCFPCLSHFNYIWLQEIKNYYNVVASSDIVPYQVYKSLLDGQTDGENLNGVR